MFLNWCCLWIIFIHLLENDHEQENQHFNHTSLNIWRKCLEVIKYDGCCVSFWLNSLYYPLAHIFFCHSELLQNWNVQQSVSDQYQNNITAYKYTISQLQRGLIRSWPGSRWMTGSSHMLHKSFLTGAGAAAQKLHKLWPSFVTTSHDAHSLFRWGEEGSDRSGESSDLKLLWDKIKI